MTDDDLLAVLHDVADAVHAVLGDLEDWGESGAKAGQYHSDVAADRVAVERLLAAGLGVLSEETGLHDPDRPLVAVVDPVDGSTNASRRLPWFATSVCVVDADGPRVSLVVDQAGGTRFEAVRGGGARRDGEPIAASGCERLAAAIVGIAGLPPGPLGWSQFRAFGAAALDLCAVASGRLDAWADYSRDAHGPWDFLGATLVCTEAGAVVADALDRPLVTLDPTARRAPVAAATPALLAELRAAGRPPG